MSEEEFLGHLMSAHGYSHVSLSTTQNYAWIREFQDLKNALKNRQGRILLEYSLPGLSKNIDVVLLINNKVYVLEYKVNSDAFTSDAIHQTRGYALRLIYFHSRSNDLTIVPILVATDAGNPPIPDFHIQDSGIMNLLYANSQTLPDLLTDVERRVPNPTSDDLLRDWELAVFKSSPPIIEAARDVWRQNNVQGFQSGVASKETRLEAEDTICEKIVPETTKRCGKAIVFLTGVPGAGKTLVGLNISVRLQSVGASMLSGNGPLVEVLSAALKRDLRKYKKDLKEQDDISVESIIRGAYGYKKEIFDKRLDYYPGGVVKLKENADISGQHVIIFDEAQRAWSKAKMIQPGRTAKKNWQEEEFPFSEPALLMWDMNNRPDWGVFVALIGGGQEINNGEAGIAEWLKSLVEYDEFKDWDVYMAPELQGDEYNGTSEHKSFEEYKEILKSQGRLIIEPSLHLAACQRTNRSDRVSKLIQEVLNCESETARQTYSEIKSRYPIYLTRSVETAKKQVRQNYDQLKDRGYGLNASAAADEIRVGMLMSSSASRLRPLGFEIRKVGEFTKTADWFLNPISDINSSNFLEIAHDEFFVQGLEIDYAALLWDADFRYNPETND